MPNIFITGASKRIGRHLALRFAADGWNIAVHYNSSENEAISTFNEIIDLGVSAVLVKADVRNQAEIRSAIAEANIKLAGIDVLVNNAGVFPSKTAIGNITEELWEDTLNINLRGEFYFAQAFAEIARENARIINISSVGGAEVWRGRIPYNVSKAGVIQLTKALAVELAPKIAVNCVAPGIIDFPSEDASEQITVPSSRIPMQRYGSPDDMFDAVRFFAEASNYITGQTLFVDGGYHIAR